MLEVGSSNIFFVFKDKHGIEVATPDLEDLVLPGITRDSILVPASPLRNCFATKGNIRSQKEIFT